MRQFVSDNFIKLTQCQVRGNKKHGVKGYLQLLLVVNERAQAVKLVPREKDNLVAQHVVVAILATYRSQFAYRVLDDQQLGFSQIHRQSTHQHAH